MYYYLHCFRCKVGWWGKNCDKCYPYPGCVNGNCSRPWECNCKPGWGGMLCDEGKCGNNITEFYSNTLELSRFLLFAELNYCEKNPDTCKNGAKCISLTKEDGKYRCLCREGTSGKNCEVSKQTTTTTTTTEMVNIEELNATTEDLNALEEQSVANEENNINSNQ